MELANPEAGVGSPSLEFYRQVIAALQRARVPCLVGGAYAFALQTRVERLTKDAEYLVTLRAAQQSIAEDWGHLDGRATQRMLDLFDSLAKRESTERR